MFNMPGMAAHQLLVTSMMMVGITQNNRMIPNTIISAINHPRFFFAGAGTWLTGDTGA